MLQWNDGTWEHRAYWGANQIGFGVDGTNSRRYMGTLPAAGQWVRLEVAASLVGLEGRSLNGMAFTLYGGRATWDHAGKRPAATGGGLLASHHVYFPFGEEITPSGSEQMKFTGHQRDAANVSSVADDLDYMHARYYNPLIGRFLSVDPVLNLKRAATRPQNWNRYAYAMGNPMKYVDPTGQDISLRISFAGSITDEERKKIIAAVKAWYERNGAGKAYVFDSAKGKHGGNLFSRLFGKGYQNISVAAGASRQHTPGTVYAGNFKDLTGQQFVNAVSNSILHETAAHLFGVTPVNFGDTAMFARGGNWMNNEAISSRVGTVADSQAFGDPATRGKVTDGPIPVHPEDAATIERELGPLGVEPPE